MSTWDQCYKGGKFNANFAKTQKTAKTSTKIETPKDALRKIERPKETLRKVEGPRKNDTQAFPEKISTSDECCESDKFKANAKTEGTAETLREIEKTKKKELEAFPETSDESQASYAYANEKDEKISVVKNAKPVEFQFSFSDFVVNDHLLNWIESLEFHLPNRVQNEVLYHLSEKEDCVIIAPKKSGKTSAALIWVLNKILCDKNIVYPKALVICPTYEIADATYNFVKKVSKYSEIKVYLAMKGKKFTKDEQVTADLIVATPGKALELSNLKNVQYLIFDDAHVMSDAVGHLKTLSQICSMLKKKCCIILCTLFCNKLLQNFIDNYLMQNQRIEIEDEFKKALPKEIFIVYSNKEERIKAFMYLEKSSSYKGQTVVFCRTKDESNRLKATLDAENISVELLNGDLKPDKRKNIREQFKENKIKMLITTCKNLEVLEAENISKVINYEQVLNIEHKLDSHFYGQIENMLNGRKTCLISSFIEQKWEDALIYPKPGSIEVYPNATRISVNELIAGQNFKM